MKGLLYFLFSKVEGLDNFYGLFSGFHGEGITQSKKFINTSSVLRIA